MSQSHPSGINSNLCSRMESAWVDGIDSGTLARNAQVSRATAYRFRAWKLGRETDEQLAAEDIGSLEDHRDSQATAPMTTVTTATGSSQAQLSATLAALLGIDLNSIRASVDSRMAERETSLRADLERIARESARITIQLPDRPVIELSGETAHEQLAESLKILRTLGILWLAGPAGCGKTYLASQLARCLELPFSPLSCTSGISESHFVGRRDLAGSYVETAFLRAFESGGVVLLDEFDAADPNIALVVNGALANGHLSVPLRADRPIASRHPDFYVIFATNTWGLGPDGTYTGREGLDASTRDRAVLAKIALGYSHAIERAYLGDHTPETPPARWEPRGKNFDLAAAFAKIRSNIREQKIRRILSTRAFEQAAKLRLAGFDNRQILALYFTDWTEAERSKALVNSGVTQ